MEEIIVNAEAENITEEATVEEVATEEITSEEVSAEETAEEESAPQESASEETDGENAPAEEKIENDFTEYEISGLTPAQRRRNEIFDKITTGILILLMASPVLILAYIFIWFLTK